MRSESVRSGDSSINEEKHALERSICWARKKWTIYDWGSACYLLTSFGRDHEMHFSDLVNDSQNYLGTSNSDIRSFAFVLHIVENFDGILISLVDNMGFLFMVYCVDEIDEEIIALEERRLYEVTPKAKNKRVCLYVGCDSDAIDYNADDPEWRYAYSRDPAFSYDDETSDDEKNEVEAYDAEINERSRWDLGEDVDLHEDDDEFSDDDAETSEE